jgi:hypothetical protein
VHRSSSPLKLLPTRTGPLVPEFDDDVPADEVGEFINGVRIATDKLREFGFDDDDFGGKVRVVHREDGERANGRYTPKNDLIRIFSPAERGPQDYLWTIVHEVLHRIWVKHLDKDVKDLWAALCTATGKDFDHHAAEALAKTVKRQPDKSSLWFYFNKHFGDDLGLFKLWLKTLRPSDSFPSQYANADPAEAFAEVGASVILGRGHAGREMKRSGSMITKMFLAMVGPVRNRNTLSKCLESAPGGLLFEDVVEHAMLDKDENFLQTQVDFGYLRVSLPRWIEKNVNSDDILKIEHRPHSTVYYGADKRDIDLIAKVVQDYGRPIRVSLGALNVFEHEERDVLYIELVGDSLVDLHNAIGQLPHSRPQTHPQYIPHLTLAYVKKGAARKFIGQTPFKRVISARGLTLVDATGIERIIRPDADDPLLTREPILLAGR